MSLWKDKKFLIKVGVNLVLLIVSLIAAGIARTYIGGYLGYVVPDILLDHLPTIDVSYIFFQGLFFFIITAVCVLVLIPESIPFTLVASALFFIIRSIFMVMTHLSAPAVAHYSYYEYEHHVKQVLFSLDSGNDLFFSGHTGFPFLLTLIFWRFAYLRYYFLLCTIIGSVAVIIGHLHYSIDVFSAFFITYGILEIAKRVFKKQYEMFN